MMCIVSRDGELGLMECHELISDWPAEDGEEPPPFALYFDWRIGKDLDGGVLGFDSKAEESPEAICRWLDNGMAVVEAIDVPEPTYSDALDWITGDRPDLPEGLPRAEALYETVEKNQSEWQHCPWCGRAYEDNYCGCHVRDWWDCADGRHMEVLRCGDCYGRFLAIYDKDWNFTGAEAIRS